VCGLTLQDITDYVATRRLPGIEFSVRTERGGQGRRLRFVAHEHLVHAPESRDHLGAITRRQGRWVSSGVAVDKDEEGAIRWLGFLEQATLIRCQHVEPAPDNV